jgi:hypothetical protein
VKHTITDKVNVTLLVAMATAIVWMYSTFASAAEVEEIKLAVLYGQYYDRLDDYDESIAEGNEPLAEEYKRQMERIKAQICELDPEWERCNED